MLSVAKERGFYESRRNEFMSYGGCLLIPNLTGCNNDTKASAKIKNEQNAQLFYERVSFLEGEICTFTICNEGYVELLSELPQLCAHVYVEGDELEMTLSNFIIDKNKKIKNTKRHD